MSENPRAYLTQKIALKRLNDATRKAARKAGRKAVTVVRGGRSEPLASQRLRSSRLGAVTKNTRAKARRCAGGAAIWYSRRTGRSMLGATLKDPTAPGGLSRKSATFPA